MVLSINERKLILRWHGEGKNQQEIADLVGCHQTSVSRLIKKFTRKGIVENLPRSGRPTKLKGKTFVQIKKKILNKINSENTEFGYVSTKEIKELIAKEIGVSYTIRHVERLMHKMGFSLIIPRPQHIRHNQKKVDNFRDKFKKNFSRNMWTMKSSPSTKQDSN